MEQGGRADNEGCCSWPAWGSMVVLIIMALLFGISLCDIVHLELRLAALIEAALNYALLCALPIPKTKYNSKDVNNVLLWWRMLCQSVSGGNDWAYRDTSLLTTHYSQNASPC